MGKRKVIPDGLVPKPYQREGIKQLIKLKRSLLADEPGLGKTMQAIVAHTVWQTDTILVVCPAFLTQNWLEEWEMWDITKRRIFKVEGKKSVDKYSGEKVLIVSYASVKLVMPLLPEKGFGLICDEAHYLKNWNAMRTNRVLVDLVPRSSRFIAITGTPMKKNVADIHPVASVCSKNFPPIQRFCETYSTPVWDGYQTVYRGVRKKEKLKKLLRTFMIRRYKRDVAKELPEKIFVKYSISIPKELAKRSRQHKKLAEVLSGKVVETEDGMEKPAYATVRKEIGIKKVPKVVDYVYNAIDSGDGPVLVFTHHKDVNALIFKALKKKKLKVGRIVGGTPMKDRDKLRKQFQAGKLDVAVLSIQAANVGLTLTRSAYVFFAEIGQSPADMSQAIDRVHRIGQTRGVRVVISIAQDSVEADAFKALEQNIKLVNSVMG